MIKFIIGVDPGSRILGYSVARTNNNFEEYNIIDSGIIKFDKDETITKKLGETYNFFLSLLNILKKEGECNFFFGVEKPFLGKNFHSSMVINYFVSIFHLIAYENKSFIKEIEPSIIKKKIFGKGNCSKKELQFLIKNMNFYENKSKDYFFSYDESDSIAINYTLWCFLKESSL